MFLWFLPYWESLKGHMLGTESGVSSSKCISLVDKNPCTNYFNLLPCQNINIDTLFEPTSKMLKGIT